jgi:hypothetical protein
MMSPLSYLSPKAAVKTSAIHGRGLFAREPASTINRRAMRPPRDRHNGAALTWSAPTRTCL